MVARFGALMYTNLLRAHLKFCKNQLGVGSRTPTNAVLGECGRERLYVTCIIKCVKYGLKNYFITWLIIITVVLLGYVQSMSFRKKLIGPVKLEISCTTMALVGYGKTSMSQIQQLLWGYFQKELEIVNYNYGQVICMRCQN